MYKAKQCHSCAHLIVHIRSITPMHACIQTDSNIQIWYSSLDIVKILLHSYGKYVTLCVSSRTYRYGSVMVYCLYIPFIMIVLDNDCMHAYICCTLFLSISCLTCCVHSLCISTSSPSVHLAGIRGHIFYVVQPVVYHNIYMVVNHHLSTNV